jgi:hypothetical protein
MERGDIVELYFMTLIETLPSIIENGILCFRDAEHKSHRSIANKSVQDQRAKKAVPQGGRIHDYANLYFWPRNAMLSAVREYYDEMCILGVNPDVLDLPGVVVTDGNAAKHFAGFYEVTEGIAVLDREVIFARSWIHAGDDVATVAHKVAMMAEVLVPGRVDPKFIHRIYVANKKAAAAFAELGLGLEVVIQPSLFI